MDKFLIKKPKLSNCDADTVQFSDLPSTSTTSKNNDISISVPVDDDSVPSVVSISNETNENVIRVCHSVNDVSTFNETKNSNDILVSNSITFNGYNREISNDMFISTDLGKIITRPNPIKEDDETYNFVKKTILTK